MSYLFFFSYARNDNEKCLIDFYNEIVKETAKRKGINESSTGFRDVSIELGESWPDSVANALKTSSVFLYLHSPNYFSSEWCGKEWYIYNLRIEKHNKRMPVMIPILWIPKKDLPDCVSAIQYSHEDLGELYSKEGLRYVMNLEEDKVYRKFIVALSKKIVNISEDYYLPEIKDIKPFQCILNPFIKISGIETNKKSFKNFNYNLVFQEIDILSEYIKSLTMSIDSLKKNVDAVRAMEEVSNKIKALALESAINAARADKYGKEFAILANELRKLSEQSQQKAGDIATFSASSLEVVEKADEALTKLSKISQMICDLSSDAE